MTPIRAAKRGRFEGKKAKNRDPSKVVNKYGVHLGRGKGGPKTSRRGAGEGSPGKRSRANGRGSTPPSGGITS